VHRDQDRGFGSAAGRAEAGGLFGIEEEFVEGSLGQTLR
jgi:hypothetical protein